MRKLAFILLIGLASTVAIGQVSPGKAFQLLTQCNWYTDETLKAKETLTFLPRSGKNFIKNTEAYYKFTKDSFFVWQTTISKSQEAKAGYDYWRFTGKWSLINGNILRLKGDTEKEFRDTYQIVSISKDKMVLKLLFTPGK